MLLVSWVEGCDDGRTSPVANATGVALGPLLATGALALRADNVLGVGELCRLALVQFLEGHFVLLLNAPPFPWDIASRTTRHTAAHARHASEAAHSAKHLGEDIVHVGSAAHAAAAAGGVEGGHAMGVVEVALIIVEEDLVGLLGGLKADLGFFALLLGDLVWVVCEGGLGVLGAGRRGHGRIGAPCGRPS